MARVEWVHERLMNWATWRTRREGRSQGFPRANILARFWQPFRNREATAIIPVNDVEAVATDRAVAALPVELRDTLEAHYVSGCGTATAAERLGCKESTVYARIDQAHQRLAVMLRAAIAHEANPAL